ILPRCRRPLAHAGSGAQTRMTRKRMNTLLSVRVPDSIAQDDKRKVFEIRAPSFGAQLAPPLAAGFAVAQKNAATTIAAMMIANTPIVMPT
ncbi:MAG: hypothetical protein WBD40_14595, partial [Tepidisphaeraceae bacterium]